MAHQTDRAGADWASQAEQDLAPIIPRAFFPWWASLPASAWLAIGAHVVDPPALPTAAAAAFGACVFGWGAVVRRGPKPTLLRSWLATIAAIGAFLLGLLAFLDDEPLLRMVWWSTSAAFLAYLGVMSLRPDVLHRPPGRQPRAAA